MEHKIACVTATLLVALLSLLIGLAALGLSIANAVGSVQESNQLNTTTSPQATAIADMQSQINALMDRTNALTDRINTPLNLYNNCTVENTICTIQIDSGEVVYRRSCLTDSQPMKVEGYYTQDIRCDFPLTGFFQVASLYTSNQRTNVGCRCEVMQLDFDAPTHSQVGQLSTICNLQITRCPLSQTLIN